MFNQLDLIKRWIGPGFVAVLIMLLYQLLVAPSVKDVLDDWNFLHAARQQVIIQAQQAQEKK
jgi:hypothetical protein